MRTALLLSTVAAMLWCQPARGDDVIALAGPRKPPPLHDRHIDYKLDLTGQTAVVRLPAHATADERLGLIVYVSPGDDPPTVPDGWADVLDARRVIFAAVVDAGNDQPVSRRCGLAVATAGRVMATHAVDPARVYAAGTSGGARIAGLLGFYQPDLFRGTVQCCGADYFRRLPHATAEAARQAGGPLIVDAAEAARAKPRVRFVLVTGDADPAHDLVADVFHGGFEHDRFQADLLDVPDRGHAPADGPTLTAALAFLDRPWTADNRRLPATAPSGKRRNP